MSYDEDELLVEERSFMMSDDTDGDDLDMPLEEVEPGVGLDDDDSDPSEEHFS